MESLLRPPPVSSCVLTIMVTLSIWKLYLCPPQMYDQEGHRLLHTAVIYKHRLMVSKENFSWCLSSYLDIGMAGAHVKDEEEFKGANALVLWVRAGLTQTEAVKWWMGYGGKSGGERVGRGGGKMCSDESKEWHEKGAKWEKGKGAAVNGGAELRCI